MQTHSRGHKIQLKGAEGYAILSQSSSLKN